MMKEKPRYNLAIRQNHENQNQYVKTHKVQGQGRTTFTKGLFANTVWM